MKNRTAGGSDEFDGRLVVAATMAVIAGSLMIAAVVMTCVSPAAAVKIKAACMSGIYRKSERPAVVIDPGHGGIDGGAVSADGVSEKDINLDIGIYIRDYLAKYSVDTYMTRETDRGVYKGAYGDEIRGPGGGRKRSIRSLKVEDLKNRRKLAEDICPDAFVSIHLNSYKEDRSVSGAQVFYSAGADSNQGTLSRNLAEKIQSRVALLREGGRERTPLEKNSVAVLESTPYPAVILECGFLSNREEAELLQSDEYKREIAKAVSEAIADFLRLEERIKTVES